MALGYTDTYAELGLPPEYDEQDAFEAMENRIIAVLKKANLDAFLVKIRQSTYWEEAVGEQQEAERIAV
ncbi:hypothetical protein [Haemophilus parahaemolyticus]|jgi:hypothetical protein|uniref:hypothetical protein n=1 Tax=Haemophilus parahaemolyticus TaxID=735 RepID=UPI002889D81B|nr:hypothetical protein [Haemophilus parahaemolyticus]